MKCYYLASYKDQDGYPDKEETFQFSKADRLTKNENGYKKLNGRIKILDETDKVKRCPFDCF